MASRAKKKAPKRAPRARIKAYMFDLDGTLVLGDRSGKSYDVLPGAIETLTRLKEQGIPYVVLTNGSAQPPPSQAAPTLLQRPAQQFDPHGRVDDSSRTNRWEGNPMPSGMPAPQPMPPPVMQPMQAISHKTADSGPRPVQQRPVHQVQMRPLSDLSKKTPAQGMGRLAPPLDPNRARTRKTQDVMIWGSVVVIIGSIVTLVIWLIAR